MGKKSMSEIVEAILSEAGKEQLSVINTVNTPTDETKAPETDEQITAWQNSIIACKSNHRAKSQAVDETKITNFFTYVNKMIEIRKSGFVMPLSFLNQQLGTTYETANWTAYHMKKKFDIANRFGVYCGRGHNPTNKNDTTEYVFFDIAKPSVKL